MGLISTEAEVVLGGRNIKWFEDKGYEIPKITNKKGKERFDLGAKILVKVEDLQDGSKTFVDVQCDHCGEILTNKKWCDYKKCVHEDGKYYCMKCALLLYGNENRRKSVLKTSKSFEQACYDNLSREYADEILERWDYELNIDKYGVVLAPKDVSFSSNGLNNKGYWFKCLKHPEHGSEQKNISNFLRSGHKGSIDCKKCISISVTHPELIGLLVNKEDALKYSVGSGEKVLMRCPECGYEKGIVIPNLLRQGFGCPRCSDGKSYPSKFIFSLFEQLNLDFEIELSKLTFKWCGSYRYDIYIKNNNSVVEVNGIHHYKEVDGWTMSLSEVQENDRQKEELALNNGVNNYIIIDARESELEWIKYNIINSDLPKLLNFKEEDIDWIRCHEFACSSLVKLACEEWNNGLRNATKIAEKLRLGRKTVRGYLKQGVQLGICDYDPKIEAENVLISNHANASIKVYCITTGEVFNSQSEAARKYNIHSNNINVCLRDKKNHKYAGKLEDGTRLSWMYYENYLELNK